MTALLLDKVAVQPLHAGNYVRVFEPDWGDVMTTNPNANGRFTLKTDMPRGVVGAASWYISDTVAGALWESVLRDVVPDDNGGVYLDINRLGRYALQAVRCVTPGRVLRMEPGPRRHVIAAGNKLLNQKWNGWFEEDVYELTHTAAGLVQLQFHATDPSTVLPGISWRSRMTADGLVYLLYDPPLVAAHFEPVDSAIALNSPQGLQWIRDTLTQANMVLLNDPAASGGTPDPGAV